MAEAPSNQIPKLPTLGAAVADFLQSDKMHKAQTMVELEALGCLKAP
jgi:hypothetical protein